MGIQKPQGMRHPNYAHASLLLLVDDLIVERLHSRPVHLWPEMMFCVITVVKPCPVIKLAIGAHAPGNWLVWVTAVMAIVAIQIREAVTEIPKRQKETDVMPVENTEDNKSNHEAGQLKHSPKRIARVLALQLFENSLRVFTKET